ncbi:MAG TPA: PepSY domain-containing protein [Rudaea sp.]
MTSIEKNNGSTRATSLYRAVWRWHFVAGLLVLPVLVLLAVTGGLYLFKPELDRWLYRALEEVPVRSAAPASVDAAVANAEQALGGQVLQITAPQRANESLQMLLRDRDGKALSAFADPYDGHLLGAMRYGGLLQTVRKIHSLQLFGFWASCIVEIAAGWAIVLVGTGVFLWWPRGRSGGVVTVRGKPAQRTFWRDLHAVTGAFAAIVIAFLAVTGMPWSMFWGDHVQTWVTAANLYEPAPPAKVTPGWMLAMDMPGMSMPEMPMSATDMPGMDMRSEKAKPDRPWALEKAPVPRSTSLQNPAERMRVSIDGALATFEKTGLARPFTITLPEGPNGAFVGDYRPDRVEDSRTVYLDQYTMKVLGDVGFAQWGAGAKAIEWGIAVHQGQEYGAVNRIVMLLGCVAIVLLAVTSVTMWWKRRPARSLGMPPPPPDRKAGRGLLATLVVIGLLYPLVGATLLVVLIVEAGWQRLSSYRT